MDDSILTKTEVNTFRSWPTAWKSSYCVNQHTWCGCGRRIPQPGRQDTWDPPSFGRGFRWRGMPEWGASKIDTHGYVLYWIDHCSCKPWPIPKYCCCLLLLLAYQLSKQFLWGHVECHGINYLKIHRNKRNLLSLISSEEPQRLSCRWREVYCVAYQWKYPPGQHSAWDCHSLCYLHRCLPHPLDPVPQVGALRPARGKWPSGWGSAASASKRSTNGKKKTQPNVKWKFPL